MRSTLIKLIVALATACTLSNYASAAIVHPDATSWMRLSSSASQLKIAPKGRFIAYVGEENRGLHVLDTQTRKIFSVTTQFVSSSFFWSPDGFRVVYREMGALDGERIDSIVKVFDCKLMSSVTLNRFDHRTGFLTFDPRDFKFLLMHKSGIHSMHIAFPDIRLARWQLAQKEDFGKWVAAQNGILWVTMGGLTMKRMTDDGSPVDSFDLSPDGKSIAWATTKGIVYTSNEGGNSVIVGFGKDPDWHAKQNLLLYAGFHMTGNIATGSDLRVVDQSGRGRWITQTQYSNERWPQWQTDRDAIIFTKEKTTDLYTLDFKP
jgi:Tol biopolymer transport system component